MGRVEGDGVERHSINQDVNGWNLCCVIDMCDMFQHTISLYQKLGGWDLSRVTNKMCTFKGIMVLMATLQKTNNVSSLFDGGYRNMPRKKHRQVFAGEFVWQSRVPVQRTCGQQLQGSRCHQAQQRGGAMACDVIFDMEDNTVPTPNSFR